MKWEYLVATLQGFSLIFDDEEGSQDKRSIRGGLDHLGSLGWELVTSSDESLLGSPKGIMLIFKRPRHQQ